MAKQSHEVAADWRELNIETLPSNIRDQYALYKEAQRIASEERQVFERMMSDVAACPPGQRLAFGYRFGKLSIAIIPDDKPAKRTAPAASLADFMRSASLTGTRT